MSTKTFNVSFPQPLVSELDRFARKDGLSRSELLRVAARSYLNWWSGWNEASRDMQVAAKRLGIRTMEDVDRIVHEVRDEMASEEAARK